MIIYIYGYRQLCLLQKPRTGDHSVETNAPGTWILVSKHYYPIKNPEHIGEMADTSAYGTQN